MDTTISI